MTSSTRALTLCDHIGGRAQDYSIHNRIVSALKRAFSRSPAAVSFLKKHRREEAWIKKDGTIHSKPKVFYTCNACKQEHRASQIQVDHIESVIPLNIPAKHLSYDTLISRLFCTEEGLQILCKKDHAEKSAKENATRDAWVEKEKFIVYETRNLVNDKRYIGVHKCVDYDDIYFGSGTLLKQAIKKYGAHNFYRHIMFVYDNPEEAFAKEHELVNSAIVESDQHYNLAIGGSGNVPQTYADTRKKVICHQTGDVFDSVGDAAQYVGLDTSAVSRALNNPHQPVKNLHFFTLAEYDEKVLVTFPTAGRAVVALQSLTTYQSIQDAAIKLSLNYKSLRNAMSDPDDSGICSLNGLYFIYADRFDSSQRYTVTLKHVRLVELDKVFPTCIEAAVFTKHKKPSLGGIAIGRAVRTGVKMYGYHWEAVDVLLHFNEEQCKSPQLPEVS